MSIKLEAAYHEAGHAVVAYHSKFHALLGEINLLNYGAGEIFISLSKSKCLGNNKAPSASSAQDKDVSKELAVILCAGYVAEQIAAEKNNSLKPSRTAAGPDYMLAVQNLKNAGLSHKYDFHHANARESLEVHWESVERIAAFLFENKKATAEEVVRILENV